MLPFIGLAILLVIAGCTIGPFRGDTDQDRPVELVMNNSANATQTFEVWVVNPKNNLTVRLNDSRTINTTISPGLTSSSSGQYYYYTAVEPPESARLHDRFTIKPGEEKHGSIEEFPRTYAVVVVLIQGDKIGWYATAKCGNEALTGLEIITRPHKFSDAGAAYQCG